MLLGQRHRRWTNIVPALGQCPRVLNMVASCYLRYFLIQYRDVVNPHRIRKYRLPSIDTTCTSGVQGCTSDVSHWIYYHLETGTITWSRVCTQASKLIIQHVAYSLSQARPTNTRRDRWSNVVLLSSRRRRRRTNHKTTLNQRLVFTGRYSKANTSLLFVL